jgi:hypothetical protein
MNRDVGVRADAEQCVTAQTYVAMSLVGSEMTVINAGARLGHCACTTLVVS